jgi:hypothetical protein
VLTFAVKLRARQIKMLESSKRSAPDGISFQLSILWQEPIETEEAQVSKSSL